MGRVQEVFHVYDYIDFKPLIPSTVAFQPDLMLPGGQGCEWIEGLQCASDLDRADELQLLAAMSNSQAFERAAADALDRCRGTGVTQGAHAATLSATGVLLSSLQPPTLSSYILLMPDVNSVLVPCW